MIAAAPPPRRAPLISRERAIAQLRELARGRIVRRSDLAYPLRLALRAHFGTFANARIVAGVMPIPRWRVWSLPRVLDDLKRLHRAGVRITVPDIQDAGRKDLIYGIYKFARSMDGARRLAGIPTPRRRPRAGDAWDPESVIAEIRRLRRAGEPLAMSKVDRKLRDAGRNLFGGWREAIEAAGIDYATVRLVREQYQREEIIESLRRLSEKKPKMTVTELSQHRIGRAARKWLGSVERALDAADVSGWPIPVRRRPATKREVIAALRARRRAGKPVYEAAIRHGDQHLHWSGIVRWGRWPLVLRAARLRDDTPKRRRWSRETVVAALRARKRKGLTLRHAFVYEEDSGLVNAAAKYCGSYREAAKLVGFDAGRRQWTRQTVIDELRARAKGAPRVTIAMAGGALTIQAKKLFGKFSAACRAAGLESHTKRERARADARP